MPEHGVGIVGHIQRQVEPDQVATFRRSAQSGGEGQDLVGDAGATPYYSAAPDGPPIPKRPLLYRPVPPDAITREDGQFLISPGYLAARLGMDEESLRLGLRSGEVVSQSEAGSRADAGKTPLIIRPAHRVWAAEIAADGSAYEVPAPRAAAKSASVGSTLRDRIRAHLSGLSAEQVPMTYGKLARTMGLYMPGSIAKGSQALEATMVEDAKNEVPFLASLVVNKVAHGDAAIGFLQQPRTLGPGPGFGENDRAYFQREFIGAVVPLAARR